MFMSPDDKMKEVGQEGFRDIVCWTSFCPEIFKGTVDVISSDLPFIVFILN